MACNFSLRPSGADYVDVTVFNNQAAVCGQYLTKGRRVAVEGRLQHSEWQRRLRRRDGKAGRPWRHLSRVCSS